MSKKMHLLEVLAAHNTRTIPDRVCGSCTLCCKVVSVYEINKPKGVWCRFSRSHKGCDLYPNHPLSCEAWSCAWLASDLAENLRPDKCHVVVDIMPDTVIVTDNDTGKTIHIKAPQLWLDEKYPLAWKEEPVKSFVISTLKNTGAILLRRWKDELDACVLLTPDGVLVEINAGSKPSTNPEEWEQRKRPNLEVVSFMRSLRPTPLHQPNPITE